MGHREWERQLHRLPNLEMLFTRIGGICLCSYMILQIEVKVMKKLKLILGETPVDVPLMTLDNKQDLPNAASPKRESK